MAGPNEPLRENEVGALANSRSGRIQTDLSFCQSRPLKIFSHCCNNRWDGS